MKIITADTVAELLSRAAASPRINAGIAGTYVRPHRHRIGKWELLSVVQGKFDVVIFTSDRVVKNRVALSSEATRVVEIPGGDWHSVVFHAPAAIVLEVKAGPYKPLLDKEFASWAPPAATLFVTRLEAAAPGERL
jgi:cupin fold WbuC family metalloprotein